MTLPHKLRSSTPAAQKQVRRTSSGRAVRVPQSLEEGHVVPSILSHSGEATSASKTRRMESSESPATVLAFIRALQADQRRLPVLDTANASCCMEGLFVRPVTALDSEIVGTIEPIPTALHPDALAYQEHRETDAFLAEWMTAVRNETEVGKAVFAAARDFADRYCEDTPESIAELHRVRAEMKAARFVSSYGMSMMEGMGGFARPTSVVEAEPAGTEPVSEREPVSLPVPQKLVGAVHSIRDAIQARKLHEIKTSAVALDDEAITYLQETAKVDKKGSSQSRRLQPWQIMGLKTWLNNHFDNPYPLPHEKQALCDEFKLTKQQVSNWFINVRSRLWQPLTASKLAEDETPQEPIGLLQCSIPSKLRQFNQSKAKKKRPHPAEEAEESTA